MSNETTAEDPYDGEADDLTEVPEGYGGLSSVEISWEVANTTVKVSYHGPNAHQGAVELLVDTLTQLANNRQPILDEASRVIGLKTAR